RSGMVRTVGTYLTGNLAESLLHIGEWQQARALAASAMQGQPEGVYEATLQLNSAELSALSGDAATARTALARAATLITDPSDDQFTGPLAALDAELHRAAGEFERARDMVADALARRSEHLWVRYLWPLLWTGVRAEVERALRLREPLELHPTLRRFLDTMVT